MQFKFTMNQLKKNKEFPSIETYLIDEMYMPILLWHFNT